MCKQSDEALVDLTLPENANIYAKGYKLYLPDKKLLQKKLKEWLDEEQKKIQIYTIDSNSPVIIRSQEVRYE